MDENLQRDTRLRIDEIADLITRRPANWESHVHDRLQLLRNVLHVYDAPGGGGGAWDPNPGGGGGGDSGGEPDLGTGQQLKDYLPLWDLPDDDAMSKHGADKLEVWSVKCTLGRYYQLKNPAPPEVCAGGWHNLGSGGVRPDWEDVIRRGIQP